MVYKAKVQLHTTTGWVLGLFFIAVGLLFFPNITMAQEVWNPTDYTLYDTITIDSANIDEDLTDFPVYVDLSDLSSRFWETTPSSASLVGTDIRVTTNANVELPRELVTASSTTQTGELHFRADSISSTTDTVFRIYYNGTTTGDYERDAMYGSENVWRNGFVAVWHLGQDPSGGAGAILDSTSFENHGTSSGSMTSGDLISGQLSDGLEFDGSDDYINIPHSSSLDITGDEFTLSAWYTHESPSGFQIVVGKPAAAGSHSSPFFSYSLSTGNSDAVIAGMASTTGGFLFSQTPGNLQNLTNHHLVSTFDGSSLTGYLDAAAAVSTTNTANLVSYTSPVRIGANGLPGQYARNLIDEVRIASTSRSDAWISAEYLNQSTTTDFYTAAQAASPWNPTDYTLYDTITIDSANIDEDLTDFPVYVDLSDLSAQFWSTTPTGSTTVGTDIRITNATGTVFELPRELVAASSTAQTGELHFKAHYLSSTTDTVFRVWYNGATTGDYATSSTYGAHNVWTNGYRAVFHLQQDPTSGSDAIIDSTSNANHGTANGSMTVEDLVTAKVGGGLDLDGTDDFISIPDDTSLDVSGTELTISAWHEYESTNTQVLFGKSDANGSHSAPFFPYSLQMINGNNAAFLMGDATGSLFERIEDTADSVRDNVLQHYVGTYDGSDMFLYLDSVELASTTRSGAVRQSAGDLRIGANGDDDENLVGLIDEVRIASTSRTAAWISAEYLNQSTTTDFYTAAQAASPWNPTDYTLYDTITIDHTQIDEDLTDFPVYVDLSDLSSRFWETTPSSASLVGTDIRVTTNANVELPRELVTASSTTQTGELHFKADLISSTTDTVFRIYYNGSTEGDLETNDTNGAENVWTDYVAVYHLNQDPAAGDNVVLDSTANLNHGTASGTMTTADLVTGRLSQGIDFDGTDDYIEIPDSASLDISGTGLTISAWYEYVNSGIQILVGKSHLNESHSGPFFPYSLHFIPGDDPSFFLADEVGSLFTRVTATGASSIGAWQLYTGVYDGSDMYTYVDDTALASSSRTGNIRTSDGNFRIGANGIGGEPISGVVDEVRISPNARSAAWISAEYLNQSTTTDFYTAAQAASPWNATDWTLYDTITIDHTQIDEDLTDFPVYVDLSDLSAQFWSTTPTGSTTVGTDIRITNATGTVFELPRELVAASSTAQTGELHFKAHYISSTTDTVFRVWYNGATTGDYIASDTYGAENVWTNGFISVHHFEEDGSAVNYEDATANNNDAVPSAIDADDQVAGKLGNAVDVDLDENAAVADNGTYDWTVGGISGWVRTDTLTSDGLMASRGDAGTADMIVWFDEVVDDFVCGASINNSFANGSSGGSYTTRSTGEWVHVLCNWDGTTLVNYTNGTSNFSSSAPSGNLDRNANEASIGEESDGDRDLDGAFDEIRYHNVARTAAWANATYLNQNITTDFYTINQSANPWNATDWTLYDTITIDHTQIDEDLTDFPVYVDLGDLSNRFWNTTPSDSDTVGTDIRITNATGTVFELPRELVAASSTAQTGELHFKAHYLSSTTDTVFRIYYSGTTTGDYIASDTYGAENVWTNGFVGVWHMEADTLLARDSTGQNNDATSVSGALASTSSQVGGGAAEFDDGTDFIDLPDDIMDFSGDFTVSSWSFYESGVNGNNAIVSKVQDGANFAFVKSNLGRKLAFDIKDADVAGGLFFGGTPLDDLNEWEYAVIMIDSSDVAQNFVAFESYATGTIGQRNDKGDLRIGDSPDTFWEALDGMVDEVRIASTTRSLGWINAAHSNQGERNSFYTINQSANPWNATDWTLFDTITIDHTQIDEDLTDFPVYVDLGDLSNRFWNTTPSDSGTVGTDIRITTDAESPVELARELVTASSTQETGELHFRADVISSTTDTIFRIYYNGTTTGDYHPIDTYGRNNVWDNGYVGVWHLSEDPTGQIVDATGIGLLGQSIGSMDASNLVAGKVGQSLDFDGSDDRIFLGYEDALNINQSLTLQTWANNDLTGANIAILGKTTSGNEKQYAFVQQQSPDEASFSYERSSNNFGSPIGDVNQNEWYAITTTLDESLLITNYLNGSSTGSETAPAATLLDHDADFEIGRWGYIPSYYDGQLDEVRISNVVRSEAWISAEYTNQSTTSNFYSASADEWNATDWVQFDVITIDADVIDESLSNFPVYVDLSDLSANFWTTVSDGGGDIRVTTDEATPQELAREVVTASTTAQTGELHFKADFVNQDADTSFRIYYNGTADDYVPHQTYGAQNVWTMYEAVWHMQEDPTGLVFDSTGNNHATSGGSMTSDDLVAGKLGQSIEFDATDDFLNVSNPDIDVDSFYVSVWAAPNSFGENGVGRLFQWGQEGVDGLKLYQFGSSALEFETEHGITDRLYRSFETYPTTGEYVHMVAQVHAVASTTTGVDFYTNNVKSGTLGSTPSGNYASSTGPFYIGNRSDQGRTFDGGIDEMRVSSTTFSDAWISAEFANQSTTSLFYTLETGTGSSTLADHDAGQVSNQFSFQNETSEALFTFKLIPETGNATVTRLQIAISGAQDIHVSDFSNLRLYKDNDNDAAYDSSDEQISGVGVMTLEGQSGVITFDSDFLATTSRNYILVADWQAPENGAQFNLNLFAADIIMQDNAGGVAVTGTVETIQHHRLERKGGGGSSAQVGGAPPAGDGDVGGGGQSGGDAIDGIDELTDGENIVDDPSFFAPSSTGDPDNDFTNPTNAFVSDGVNAITTGTSEQSYADFSFALPSGDEIKGIEVKVDGQRSAYSISVSLSWDGGTSYTSIQAPALGDGLDTVQLVGGPTDTWGRTWTQTELNNTNFRLRIAGTGLGGGTVDALQVRVHTQASGGSSGGGGAI